MFSTTRRILTIALAVPVLMSVQGCTEEDFAVGLGAVAIIGGAIAIGAGTQHDRPYEPHHDGRRDFHPGGGRRGWANSSGKSFDLSSMMTPADKEAKLAAHLGLPVASSVTLNSALAAAGEAKNLNSVYQLGLNKEDVSALSQSKMITQQGLINLGRSLNVSSTVARNAVQTMLNDVKAQAADSSSIYWQTCTQSGSWKTPENAFCSNAAWAGCSVETGATLCLAK